MDRAALCDGADHQSTGRARHLLIEQAEKLGESPEDPLLAFSVLYGFWMVSHVAFNGDDMCKRAAQFFMLAERQGSTMLGVLGIARSHEHGAAVA
jgi:hypothetical protein